MIATADFLMMRLNYRYIFSKFIEHNYVHIFLHMSFFMQREIKVGVLATIYYHILMM